MHTRSTSRPIRSTLCLLAATGIITATGQTANAQCAVETWKLLANDGATDDNFGLYIAISGTTALVGARENDDNGTQSGSAYLFDTTTGAQIAKLLPEDGARGDLFGHSVAISGTTALVGAFGDDDNGEQSGSAYLFDTTTGAQIAKLLPEDGAELDYFGWSVAISGTTALVGAIFADDLGSDPGSAYLFDTTTGMQIAKLLPADGDMENYFGSSVAIRGTIAIVGAHYDDDNGTDSGSAYLFDTTTGIQIAKLLPLDGEAYDEFGVSVAISGTTAIVGAYRDNDNGSRSGSAYLFDTTTGAQIAKILPDVGESSDHFGVSVAISGTTAIIGAHSNDDNGISAGSAYLFDTTTGAQIAKLLPEDGAAEDFFGFSVSISGTTALVGAVGDDDDGFRSGSAYLFEIIDVCPTLTVTPEPLLAGQNGTFTVTNMTPSDATFLAYSIRGFGRTYIASLNVALDLTRPVQAGNMIISDSLGTAQWLLPIPSPGAGRNLWLQACQSGVTTNVVATRIE